MSRPRALAADSATGIWVQALGLDNPGDALIVMDTRGHLRLIDAGRHPTEVAGRLRDAAVTRIRSAVCTHSDGDHVGGMAAVLRDVLVDELWVPATWGDAIVGAATGTDDWREPQLTPQSAELHSVTGHDRPGAGYGAHYLLPREQPDGQRAVLAHGITLLGESLRTDHELRRTLTVILDVIGAAVDRGIRVRFFSPEAARANPDPYLWQTAGDLRCLTFLNAREVAVGNCPPVTLDGVVRLAAEPRVALVPVVHGAAQGSDALICSGSTFEFLDRNPVPWDNIGLVVAPHHGSVDRAADRLYRDAADREYAGYWIRSHDDHATWPDTNWLQLDPGRRYCTRCRGAAASGGRAQDLTFSLGLGWEHPWHAHPIGLTRPCRCA